MLAQFAVGQVLWSLMWFFLFVLWIMLIFMVFGDLFRDRDSSGAAKVLWSLFIIVLPFLGIFLYLIIRGRGMSERAAKMAEAQNAQYVQHLQATASSQADELSKLHDLKSSGAITDAEYDAMKGKIVNA